MRKIFAIKKKIKERQKLRWQFEMNMGVECLSLTWWWSHAYETTTVAQTTTTISLVSWRGMVVKGKVCFARWWLDANRIAHKHYSNTALTQVRALGFVFTIKLKGKKKIENIYIISTYKYMYIYFILYVGK